METLYNYIDFNLYALSMIGIGMVIRYLVARRRFSRRGIGGLQHYSSYGKAVFITLLEWLFQWLANVLMVIGIFLSINW
jgi:hypothetical protein